MTRATCQSLLRMVSEGSGDLEFSGNAHTMTLQGSIVTIKNEYMEGENDAELAWVRCVRRHANEPPSSGSDPAYDISPGGKTASETVGDGRVGRLGTGVGLFPNALAKEPGLRAASARALREAFEACNDVAVWSERDAQDWWDAHASHVEGLRRARERARRSVATTVAIDFSRTHERQPARAQHRM